jgi:hypothetical protein
MLSRWAISLAATLQANITLSDQPGDIPHCRCPKSSDLYCDRTKTFDMSRSPIYQIDPARAAHFVGPSINSSKRRDEPADAVSIPLSAIFLTGINNALPGV